MADVEFTVGSDTSDAIENLGKLSPQADAIAAQMESDFSTVSQSITAGTNTNAAQESLNALSQQFKNTADTAASTAFESAATWREFVGQNMSAAMQMAGSHGAAMTMLGQQWQALKAQVADTSSTEQSASQAESARLEEQRQRIDTVIAAYVQRNTEARAALELSRESASIPPVSMEVAPVIANLDELLNGFKKVAVASTETEAEFARLSVALDSGTDTAVAQASLSSLDALLKSGAIDADQYGSAVSQIQIDSGLASEASQAAADALLRLNQQFSEGQINSNEYAAGVKAIQDNLGSVQPEADKAALSFTEINQALELGQKVIESFKAAFDFAEQGAMIERIGDQWAKTAADFGVNADAVIAAMDRATNGTVDDEALMQTAARAFTQGVATNLDQMTQFTEIARAAAVRFGLDTTTALEKLAVATEAGQTRGLKLLGIYADFNKAYETLAAHEGKRVADLTDEEKLQARVHEVLTKGAELVQKVGDTGADSATKFEQFKRETTELGDALKELAANALLPTITNAVTLLTAQRDLENEMKAHEEQARKSIGTYKDYQTEIERSGTLTGELTTITDDNARAAAREALDAGTANGQYVILNDTIYKVSSNLKIATEAEYDQVHALDAAQQMAGNLDYGVRHLHDGEQALADALAAGNQGLENQAAAFDTAVLAAQRHAQAISDADKSLSILKISMAGAVSKEMNQYATKNDELRGKLEKVAGEIAALEKTQGTAVTTSNKHALSSAELTLAQLKLSDAQSQLAKTTDPMKQAELAVKIEDLKGKIDGASGSVTHYVDNSKKLGELKTIYDDLNNQIAQNDAAHTRATKDILFNIAEQQLATINDPVVRAEAMNKLALQWGMIDKKTYDAVQGMIASTHLLAENNDVGAWVNRADRQLGNLDLTWGKLGKEAPPLISQIKEHRGDIEQLATPLENARRKVGNYSDGWNDLVKTGAVHDAIITHTKDMSNVEGSIASSKTAISAYSDTEITKLGGPVHTAILAHQKDIENVKTPMNDLNTSFNAYSDTEMTKLLGPVHTAILDHQADLAAVKTPINDAGTAAQDYINKLNSIPHVVETTFITHYQSTGEPPSAGPTAPSFPSSSPHGAQMGADFMVPPNPRGGLGDYFPVLAAPGERVTVQTAAQQQAQPARANQTHNYVTINDPLTGAIWLTYIYGQRRTAMDALM